MVSGQSKRDGWLGRGVWCVERGVQGIRLAAVGLGTPFCTCLLAPLLQQRQAQLTHRP